jgi:glycosyltransferase involved in cell wall biosynthesis/SAM-dependent methyltransferase
MSAPSTPATAQHLACNVAGFLRGGLGLGEAARLYVVSLRSAGVPVQTTSVAVPLPELPAAVRKEAEFDELTRSVDPRFNVVCVNAPELPRFYHDVGPGFFEGKRTVGVWAWETDRVPDEWEWAFSVMDEIWTYSRYVVDVLSAASPVQVRRVPLPVLAPEVKVAAPNFGLPERFTFLTLFDFYSTLQRKNPEGLIEAFKRAFRPGEGPQLLVKSFNGDYKPERLEQLQRAAAGHPDVHLVDRYVSRAEKDALIAEADCYVSLHRSEGFGLPLAEAMALGTPVIATGYSGNVDFMNEENSWPVRYELTEVGPDGENYPPDGHWAEPDLDHAAQRMREVWEDDEQREHKSARGRDEVAEMLSVERVGEVARGHLEEAARGKEARRLPPKPPPPELGWPSIMHAQRNAGFNALAAARKEGGPRAGARALALLAMRPHTYHQNKLNQLLVEGLHGVAARLDHLTWALEGEAGLSPAGRQQLRRLLEAVAARPSPTAPAISERDESGQAVLRFDTADPESLDDVYAAFEDLFRGSQEMIRERQEVYVDMLGSPAWVLDLGCGRGEFMDVLRERQIAARGVDLNAGMVALSREKGHEVELADALDYLRALDDGSVPAIFAAQFIEHLPADSVVDLLKLAAAKLSPGGTAIFETVNPHSPAALKSFWVDPTHHHPLFPEVLLALARFAGFGRGRVEFPGGSGNFSDDIYSSPDYALVVQAAPDVR